MLAWVWNSLRMRRGIRGSQAVVVVDEDYHHHHHRHLHHVEEIIGKSDLSDLDETVKQKSLEIFMRLAEAEAKVHQTTIEQVHFHELGAIDAIIDVVGAVAGLAALGPKRYTAPPSIAYP
jgi:uncharacterized protein (DUF111 family)